MPSFPILRASLSETNTHKPKRTSPFEGLCVSEEESRELTLGPPQSQGHCLWHGYGGSQGSVHGLQFSFPRVACKCSLTLGRAEGDESFVVCESSKRRQSLGSPVICEHGEISQYPGLTQRTCPPPILTNSHTFGRVIHSEPRAVKSQ